jgi:phage regulator Rha-like protein
MVRLNAAEHRSLRLHFATLKKGRGQHRKYAPYAFTDHGALQLASVLTSPIATQVSILIVRAFVQLREVLSTHKQIAQRLEELEQKIASHDETIVSLVHAIQQLMDPPTTHAIGFQLPK